MLRPRQARMFGHRSLPIAIENPIVGPVVDGTSDSEHGVAGLLDPPGARPFQSCVADELVGRFDTAAADRRASQSARTVVEPNSVLVQICGEGDVLDLLTF